MLSIAWILTSWFQFSINVHMILKLFLILSWYKKSVFRKAFPWSKLFQNILKEIPQGTTPLAGGLFLPSGLCVVVTQKPGALSLTEMVTSVVTVLNQVMCYAKLSSITVWSVNRILLWREVLPRMTADNKTASLTENSKYIFLFVCVFQF